jgi:hypothetical protein
MSELRVKVSSVIENQLPQFIREDSPLLIDFLRQYYIAVESNGQVLDILENIDKYVKVDFITSYKSNTILTESISFFDRVIKVDSTFGFPDAYGLLKINDEIIGYESKTDNQFVNCYRGFSGVESYSKNNFDRDLIFSKTTTSEHVLGDSVENLSFLFLKQFLEKTKSQFTPGFEDRDFVEDLNQNLFIKQSKDFYSSKGTKSSFEILFNSLYGEKVEVIDPSQSLIRPSDSKYLVTRDIVVEGILGNPEELRNQTIFQDDDDYFVKSSAAVTNVEKFIRNQKVYYTLSLDYDYNRDIESRGSVIGEFSIHPKTIIINNTLNGQDYIDVDSTVGFPNSGELVVNINGVNFFIGYNSKTLNQFLQCENVPLISEKTEIRLNSYVYGYSSITGNEIQMRIGGVLSDLDIIGNTFLSSVGDTIKITSPGKNLTDVKSKNWFYNISTIHDITTPPIAGLVNIFDEHNFVEGDDVIIEFSDGSSPFKTKVLKVNNKKSISINPQLPLPINLNLSYKIRRILSKSKFKNYSEISSLNSNVQNIYYDYNDNSIYVASPSIPNYSNRELNINDGSIIINGPQENNTITAPDHSFLSGDVIYYSYGNSNENLLINEGPYFIKKLSNNSIRLFKSREDLYLNNFVKFDNSVVSNNKLSFFRLFGKKLTSQKLLRKIKHQKNNITRNKTVPGRTGILLNGVEILNYKSNDYIYYGEIEDIQVVSSSKSYDVINPPNVVVSDFNGVGVGASITLHINGNLKKINIIDPGFDYIEEPKVTIFGGNGSGAIASTKLVSFQHIVEFNSENSSVVNLVDNTITFSEDHKFRDVEEVIYKTENQIEIGGLTNNSRYFIKSINATQIKLYLTIQNAISNINPISLTSLGSGIHSFTSIENKRKLGSVNIIDSGQNYRNKKITVESSNINFRKNTIVAKNHSYSDKDIISYYSSITEIGGVLPGNYFVKVINDDEFSLVEILEDSELGSDFNFKNNTIVNFQNTGSGIHYFNYPEIVVSIDGIVGVNTFSISNSIAQLQPIFRGFIENVFIVSSGDKYGTSDIINYERPPIFTLQSGSGAFVKPIILNGKIISVSVLNSGINYNSPPELEIIGPGKGAILTPIIQNNSIVDVRVISGGFGYQQNKTEIKVKTSDEETLFKTKIKSWNINSYFRFSNSGILFENKALLEEGLNRDFDLQYSHLALPNTIRELIKTSKIFEDVEITISDIENDTKNPLLRIHSPIIGWAYDGNPIYGPYGFDLPTGGIVRRMTSGYKLRSDSTKRPNCQSGLLVEDYIFIGDGDLDESNGRYGITPEFPNGTYAYFCTVDEEFNPVFPYIIGDYYRSEAIEFNFDKNSNQDDIDINQKQWVRNTEPYKFLSDKTNYDYILNPNSIKNQDSVVSSTEYGTLDKIEIQLAGDNYKVGEQVLLKTSDNDFGSGASAEISKIFGKNVIDINTEISTIENVEFAKSNIFDNVIGISSNPHNLKSSNYITICECDVNSIILDDDFYQVKVFSTELILRDNVGNFGETGSITYFNVYGNINYPYVMEDDIFMIGNEKIKILSIDLLGKRIKVLRGYDSTTITEHSANTLIIEDPRKFYSNISFDQNFEINRRYYFDPSETVGIGTTFGVGIGSTVVISNPGVGVTQVFVPSRSLYLPNHNLTTGNKLIYSANSGIGISVSNDGINEFKLEDETTVFVAKFSNDFIGISTERVGLSSDGNFIGIGTETSILYFTSFGEGDNHSLTNNYENIFKAKVNNIVSRLTTQEQHFLEVGDNLDLELKSLNTHTFNLYYDSNSRNLIFDKQEIDDVNVDSNILVIENHKFIRGQKVLFNSFNPPVGISDGEKFYVIRVNSNQIKLSRTYYGSLTNTDIVPIELLGSYTPETNPFFLSLVNPPLSLYENERIIFDLSDSSLEGFDFNLYEDEKYRNIFYGINEFNVEKIGEISKPNSRLILTITNNIIKKLYYNLSILDEQNIFFEKLEYFIDDINIIGHNEISIVKSVYHDNHTITGIGSTYFEYNLKNSPENLNYINNINSKINYTTNSKNSLGPISKVKIKSKGRNYKKLPVIENILTEFGSGAILNPKTNTIGKINKISIKDIGFDYFSDKTLRPSAKIPEILRINPLTSLNFIKVIFSGEKYNISPNLVLIDGFTQEVVNDVFLNYTLGENFVEIIRNTTGIFNVTPRIVPINNSNGVNITNIEYNSNQKEITVFLRDSYSTINEFPFLSGDLVLIENTNILNNTGKSYNSSNYNYKLFPIKEIEPQLGGEDAYIVLDSSNFIQDDELFGQFDDQNSFGIVTPEKYFPIFEISLKKNVFFVGEKVVEGTNIGIVESWDKENELLKVSTSQDFRINSIVIGKSSNSRGLITGKFDFQSFYDISSSSIVIRSWQENYGFLNDDLQRIADNYYYQYFSYSLKSRVQVDDWDNAVSSLNHTSGFKKFSDLNIEVQDKNYSGIQTSQTNGDFSSIVDLISVSVINCKNDYDLVSENNNIFDQKLTSDQIIFESRELIDYFNCIGNRVLQIDDISNQFRSNERLNIVNRFVL